VPTRPKIPQRRHRQRQSRVSSARNAGARSAPEMLYIANLESARCRKTPDSMTDCRLINSICFKTTGRRAIPDPGFVAATIRAEAGTRARRSNQQSRRRTTPGARMRMGWFAHTPESDIGRPGGPTGVGLLDGPWGRTTARVGTISMQLALCGLPSTSPLTPAAAPEMKHHRQCLPTDASANSAHAAASGRS
jgi:hypothetical protein